MDDHNNLIINNLNEKIGPEDTLYCLGDFALGGVANYFKFREQINCRHVHLIRGNHDDRHQTELDPEFEGKKTSSLFVSYDYYKEIRVSETLFCLFHFPIHSWNSMNLGSIHLFGHTHSPPNQRFFNGGKSMDVGVDGNSYKPYSIDEIMDIMKDRPTKKEGHHV
jgi:calcineurin-like phosphoesterase family protein